MVAIGTAAAKVPRQVAEAVRAARDQSHPVVATAKRRATARPRPGPAPTTAGGGHRRSWTVAWRGQRPSTPCCPGLLLSGMSAVPPPTCWTAPSTHGLVRISPNDRPAAMWPGRRLFHGSRPPAIVPRLTVTAASGIGCHRDADDAGRAMSRQDVPHPDFRPGWSAPPGSHMVSCCTSRRTCEA